MNYLKFYKECMKTGKLPNRDGLCDEFHDDATFLLFKPTKHERDTLAVNETWWASDHTFDWKSNYCELVFGPTRQNIVLLLAAINGQL